MSDRKLWTAEELEALPPAERYEVIRSGIVTDMDRVPPAFLERVRQNVRDHIASEDAPAVTDR